MVKISMPMISFIDSILCIRLLLFIKLEGA
jgi:hypothetical protein